jgi:hypothetical protein
LLSVLLLWTSGAIPAFAETVSLTSAMGTTGTAGLDGAPGEPGGTGGDSDDVLAVADATGEDNTAAAQSGSGGTGGSGGDALSGSGTDGGDGGAGGSSGNAVAEATTVNATHAVATATAGYGGSGGFGGVGASPGINGVRGPEGVSGDATATASATNEFNLADPSTGLVVSAHATSRESATLGGNAIATAIGDATGEGDATRQHSIEAVAVGGQSVAHGGDATAQAQGTTNHGGLSVVAEAYAGSDQGLLLANSGHASALAEGTHTGAGSLNVQAYVRGNPDASGVPDIHASGVATAGADVSVRAQVYDASVAELRNAVDGSTSGRLDLTEVVSSYSHMGGTEIGARASLVAENPGGGDLGVHVAAYTFPATTTIPSLGVPATTIGDVIGRSDTGANVDVSVTAQGQEVRLVDLDDPSRASRIEGVSNGGDVSVSADLRVSLQRVDQVGDDFYGSQGPSISLDNAVSGSTSGNLVLSQFATAGSGASISPINVPGTATSRYLAGDGGDATNQLSHSGAHESLRLEGQSTGGNGGTVTPGYDPPADGGSATLSIAATNSAGSATVQGYARGGSGGSTSRDTGDGGDATVDLAAESFGDGSAVAIGHDATSTAAQGARAGSGGAPYRRGVDPSIPARAGTGGDAASRSIGQAHGDSTVDVYDEARGGSGGGAHPIPQPSIPLPGGDGGDASSEAHAIGGGASRVLASSVARAGSGSADGYDDRGYHGFGGNALAQSYANGLGEVVANSSAYGGSVVWNDASAGSARATAEAAGLSGSATAVATTGFGTDASFRALVTRDVHSTASVEATATYQEAFAADPGNRDGRAFLTGSPLGADVATAAGAHAGLAELLSTHPTSHVEALGDWLARGTDPGGSGQSIALDLTLATPTMPATLGLAIFDLGAVNGGFDELTFGIEVRGTAFGEQHVFTTLAEAQAFFANMINLGDAFLDDATSSSPPGVRLQFDWTGHEGQEVAFGLAAVVVPEPSTAILIGCGLGLLTVRGRNGRASSAA